LPPPSFRDYRLPRGNHGLSRAQVAENQRWRLIGAAAQVLAEERLGGTSSRRIARRAGVSSHTFYEHFGGVDEVLAAAFSNAAQVLKEVVGGVCCDLGSLGPEASVKALKAALGLGAAEPGLVALMRVEVAVAIPAIATERMRLTGRLGALINRATEPDTGTFGGARAAGLEATMAIAIEQLEAGGATGAMAAELGGLLR
jgi:AcrR family transcriptional regulator